MLKARAVLVTFMLLSCTLLQSFSAKANSLEKMTCEDIFTSTQFSKKTSQDEEQILLREFYIVESMKAALQFRHGDIVYPRHRSEALILSAHTYHGTELKGGQVMYKVQPRGQVLSKEYLPVRNYDLLPQSSVMFKPLPGHVVPPLTDSQKEALVVGLKQQSQLIADVESLGIRMYADTPLSLDHIDHTSRLVSRYLSYVKTWNLKAVPLEIFYQSNPLDVVPEHGPLAFVWREFRPQYAVLMQDFSHQKEFQFSDSILLHELTHILMYANFPFSVHARFESLAEALADFLPSHFLDKAMSIHGSRDVSLGIGWGFYSGKNLQQVQRRFRGITHVTDLRVGHSHENSVLYSRFLWRVRQHIGPMKMNKILPSFLKRLHELYRFVINDNKVQRVKIPESWLREETALHAFVGAFILEMNHLPSAEQGKTLLFIHQLVEEMGLNPSLIQKTMQYMQLSNHPDHGGS